MKIFLFDAIVLEKHTYSINSANNNSYQTILIFRFNLVEGKAKNMIQLKLFPNTDLQLERYYYCSSLTTAIASLNFQATLITKGLNKIEYCKIISKYRLSYLLELKNRRRQN